VIYFYILF